MAINLVCFADDFWWAELNAVVTALTPLLEQVELVSNDLWVGLRVFYQIRHLVLFTSRAYCVMGDNVC